MVGEDLYGLLEVDESASQDDIRKAYYRLAKVYHPDLQMESDEDATERFLAIQKAYGVLGEAVKRSEYDSTRTSAHPAAASASGEPDAKGDSPAWARKKVTLEEERRARVAFMKAEELIESGDLDKAIQLMDAVVRAIPEQAEYQSLYGYALALSGQRLHRARDACRRALEMDPNNPDFHAHLGYVYLRAGLKQTAETCFRTALESNPKHPVAVAHLGDEQGGSGGLFSSFRNLFNRP